jgi:hypothetical protein
MTQKEEIFISYTDLDKDKVELIVSMLGNNTKFQPLVIASNRQPLIPLAKKVADGIIRAKVFLPILTKNSINTQWINQEIGFATALGKRIIPIVDKEVISLLKGFLHKQIDLPYGFQSASEKGQENEDFVNCFRLFISDLEKDFKSSGIVEASPEKSEFQKSLEKADKVNHELDYQRKRESFFNSIEAVRASQLEVLNMFEDIKGKIKILRQKRFYFDFKEESYHPVFILKGEGFSFSIGWQIPYSDTVKNSTLFVRLWEGHMMSDQSSYFPGKEPKMLKDSEYDFDRNKENGNCWLSRIDKKQYSSEQIVDGCLHWIVEQVGNKRLSTDKK